MAVEQSLYTCIVVGTWYRQMQGRENESCVRFATACTLGTCNTMWNRDTDRQTNRQTDSHTHPVKTRGHHMSQGTDVCADRDADKTDDSAYLGCLDGCSACQLAVSELPLQLRLYAQHVKLQS